MLVRALTLRNAYACAVVCGPKRIENRGWRPKILLGQDHVLLIHAGKANATKAERDHLSSLWKKRPVWNPEGDWHIPGLVGAAKVVGVVRSEPGMSMHEVTESLEVAQHAEKRSVLSILKRSSGWLREDGFGWILDRVVLFETPHPCPGKLKLWNPSPVYLQKELPGILSQMETKA